jgi:CheY-like chemotaxis protein
MHRVDRELLTIHHGCAQGFAMTECQSVLIVDDDARLAETFAIALRHLGFAARTARNGVQGSSSYYRDPTDWVITDIEMPELDGIEMMRCIRAINPTVKTIYMSAAVQKYAPALSTESREFGAKVLPKPLAWNHWVAQISGCRYQIINPDGKVLHNCTAMPSLSGANWAKKSRR